MDEVLKSALCEALALAAKVGEVSLVSKLVAAGADPNGWTEDGSHPLELALNASNCRIETVRALLEAGSSPAVASYPEPLLTKVLYTQAPSVELVKMLLAAHDDPNAGKGRLLARSVQVHDLEIVRALVEAGADVNQPFALGSPHEVVPFEVAARRRRADIAKYLLDAGAVIPDSVRSEEFWADCGGADNPVRRMVNADTMQRTIEQVMAHDAEAAAPRASASLSPL